MEVGPSGFKSSLRYHAKWDSAQSLNTEGLSSPPHPHPHPRAAVHFGSAFMLDREEEPQSRRVRAAALVILIKFLQT